jgi:hypothetical protein
MSTPTLSEQVSQPDTYKMPAHGWTCFHCGETFTTPGSARDHFGETPGAQPGCALRVQPGLERSQLMALRKCEGVLSRLVSDMRSIKDSANEAGAGNPPDGYTELEDTKVADACWQNGLDCMETAVLNWVHDQEADRKQADAAPVCKWCEKPVAHGTIHTPTEPCCDCVVSAAPEAPISKGGDDTMPYRRPFTPNDDGKSPPPAQSDPAAGGAPPTITDFESQRGDPIESPNADAEEEVEATSILVPTDLHEHTKSLVRTFAGALAHKLRKSEKKYGYSDGWRARDWIKNGECAKRLREHVEKGDPLDVAAYCAFLRYHGASTSGPSAPTPSDKAMACAKELLKVDGMLTTYRCGGEADLAAIITRHFPADSEEVDRLRRLLYDVGICPDCSTEMSHDADEPFSHCNCGTSEDTTGPSTLQKLRIEVKALREDKARMDTLVRLTSNGGWNDKDNSCTIRFPTKTVSMLTLREAADAARSSEGGAK